MRQFSCRLALPQGSVPGTVVSCYHGAITQQHLAQSPAYELYAVATLLGALGLLGWHTHRELVLPVADGAAAAGPGGLAAQELHTASLETA